jgi:hypothetical protein
MDETSKESRSRKHTTAGVHNLFFHTAGFHISVRRFGGRVYDLSHISHAVAFLSWSSCLVTHHKFLLYHTDFEIFIADSFIGNSSSYSYQHHLFEKH